MVRPYRFGAMRRRKPPSAEAALRAVFTTKFVGDPVSEALAECGWARGFERGSRLADGTRWVLQIYRQSGGALCARLVVDDEMTIGLDFHDRSSRDRRGGIVPPGYHWDTYGPLSGRKLKFEAASPYLESAAHRDRVALTLIRSVLHIRFAPEAQPDLSLARRRRRR